MSQIQGHEQEQFRQQHGNPAAMAKSNVDSPTPPASPPGTPEAGGRGSRNTVNSSKMMSSSSTLISSNSGYSVSCSSLGAWIAPLAQVPGNRNRMADRSASGAAVEASVEYPVGFPAQLRQLGMLALVADAPILNAWHEVYHYLFDITLR